MDVREDGDAHRQSLAARSAGIGSGPRVARRRRCAARGPAASPGPAGPGRPAGAGTPRRSRRASSRRRGGGPAGPATAPPTIAGSGRHRGPSTRPPRRRASSSSSPDAALPGDERPARVEQRERQLDELRRAARRPGRRPPASARAGGRPRRGPRARPPRPRRVGASPVAATAVSRNVAFLRDRLDEQRPLGRQRGREREPGEAAAAADVDERPDARAGEARGTAARLSRTWRRASSSRVADRRSG